MSIIQSDNLSQHLTGKKDLTTISQNIRTIVQCKKFLTIVIGFGICPPSETAIAH